MSTYWVFITLEIKAEDDKSALKAVSNILSPYNMADGELKNRTVDAIVEVKEIVEARE